MALLGGGRRRRRTTTRPAPWVPPAEEAGYRGPALLVVTRDAERVELAVTVHLAGHLEPLDGAYHWYGRIDRSEALAAVKASPVREAAIVVDDGEPAPVRLGEVDPWGHVQVSGVGAPPYSLGAVEIEVPGAV